MRIENVDEGSDSLKLTTGDGVEEITFTCMKEGCPKNQTFVVTDGEISIDEDMNNQPKLDDWEVLTTLSDDGTLIIKNVYCDEHSVIDEFKYMQEQIHGLATRLQNITELSDPDQQS